MKRLLWLLLCTGSLAQQAMPNIPGGVHVLELQDSKDVPQEKILQVFATLGMDASQAAPLVQRVRAAGKSVVIAGSLEGCQAAAGEFEKLGMQAAVKPYDEAEMAAAAGGAGAGSGATPSAARGAAGGAARSSGKPGGSSEYANSDVIDADAATFKELLNDKSQGTLVTFYAPWCGHCIKMVPEYKKAAQMLKATGVRAAAVNSDNAPGLARELGINGFPTVKWVYAGKLTDYAGPRVALELYQFATTQHAIAKVKGAVAGAVSGVKSIGKLAMSKVLGRQQGQQTAVGAAAA